MIPSLYENFKKWSEKGSIWILSDLHFNDEDTRLMNPKWISPEEQIELLNKQINKNDTFICLGDCGDISYIRKLKAGYKILIKGNHDDKGNSFYKRTKEKIIIDADTIDKKELLNDYKSNYTDYKINIEESFEFHSPFHRYIITIDNNLFDEIYEGPLFISDKILLSHEPIFGLKFCLNIHGHCHNGEYQYIDIEGAKHINLAADVANYTPINLGKFIKDGNLSKIQTIHRITIDKAIENPIHKKNFKMRDATKEEQDSVNKYLKHISKETEINFWDLIDDGK